MSSEIMVYNFPPQYEKVRLENFISKWKAAKQYNKFCLQTKRKSIINIFLLNTLAKAGKNLGYNEHRVNRIYGAKTLMINRTPYFSPYFVHQIPEEN